MAWLLGELQGPGVLHASSRQAYRLDDAELEHRFTVEERVEFSECGQPDWLAEASEQPAEGEEATAEGKKGLKLKASLSLISYEARDGIVRFAPNTKITNKLSE